MVLEIALGIVLAVVIIYLLPYILALGAIAVVIGFVVAVVAGLVAFFLWVSPSVDFGVVILLVTAGILFAGVIVYLNARDKQAARERRRALGYDDPPPSKDGST